MNIQLPVVKDGEMVAVDVKFKNGELDSYDPVVEILEQDGTLTVNNSYYGYNFNLNELESFSIYIRSPKYHEDIDVTEWIDSDPTYIWEDTSET